MHLILTGATGLVGSAVLHHMLNTKTITTISILSRRPVPQAEGHPQARVYIHKDFNTYPSELLEKLSGAEGCVWALGVSTNDVPDEKYVMFVNSSLLLLPQPSAAPFSQQRGTYWRIAENTPKSHTTIHLRPLRPSARSLAHLNSSMSLARAPQPPLAG